MRRSPPTHMRKLKPNIRSLMVRISMETWSCKVRASHIISCVTSFNIIVWPRFACLKILQMSLCKLGLPRTSYPQRPLATSTNIITPNQIIPQSRVSVRWCTPRCPCTIPLPLLVRLGLSGGFFALTQNRCLVRSDGEAYALTFTGEPYPLASGSPELYIEPTSGVRRGMQRL